MSFERKIIFFATTGVSKIGEYLATIYRSGGSMEVAK